MASKYEEIEAIDALLGFREMMEEKNYASMMNFFDDLFAVYSTKFKNEILPENVESTYTGVHINERYEEEDFLRLLDSFHNGQILHAKYAMQIVKDAIEKFEKYPNILLCNLKMSKTQMPGVVIVGDLHGNFKDLYYIIQKFGIPGKNYRFVFNGDFVDRGPQQSEVLLTLLYAHLLYPTRVFLNRGNHEDLSLNVNSNFSPNFKFDTEVKFKQYSLAFFNICQRLFRRLPVATVVENLAGYKCFVCHGGISDRIDLKFVSSTDFNRKIFPSITLRPNGTYEEKKSAEQFSDLLWSDPLAPPKDGCEFNSQRRIGFLFGQSVSENFCAKNGFNTIVRSHEMRANGLSKDHEHCVTVFSCSNYGMRHNKAAVLILGSDDDHLESHVFETEHYSMDLFEGEKAKILKAFKKYLDQEADVLIEKFSRADSNNDGWLSINSWANIICEHVSKDYYSLNRKHIVALKDYFCPCDESAGTAKYLEMFSDSNKDQSSARKFEFLEILFNLIDLDRNGTISANEGKQAIKLMNQFLKTNYTTDFITRLDLNNDGNIDLYEFKTGFSKAFDMV